MSSAKPVRSRFHRILVIVVAVITIGGLFGFFVLSFGHVTGTEFAPDGFTRRDFVYFQIPLIQLQITPVVRSNAPNDLESHLTKNKVVPSRKVPSRWDSVEVSIGSIPDAGEALILCNYLDAKDANGDFVWLTWTKAAENAKKTAPFWAAVQRAAKLEAYFMIPDLFQLASESTDSKTFQTEIDALCAEQFTQAADDYAALGNQEVADRFYTAAAELALDDQQPSRAHSEDRQQPVESEPSDDSKS